MSKRVLAILMTIAMLVSAVSIGALADDPPPMPEGAAPGGMPAGEMPAGEMGAAPGGMPAGEMPAGDMPAGDMGGMPGGDMGGMPGGAPGGAPGGMPGMGAAAPSGVTCFDELTDAASIENREDVDMMIALGIINGSPVDDGYAFLPADSIERAAMAKMVAIAVTLISGEDTTGTTEFSDTADSWAKDYIAFCADKGIINGVGDGSFDPTGTVTGSETAKMLLAALGSTSTLTGADWEATAIGEATKLGLLEGVKGDVKAALTRGDAATMIANALTIGGGSLPKVVYIPETVELEAFTHAEGEMYVAPSGKDLTLTVDGVESRFAPGAYTGKIVLTVTEAFTVANMGTAAPIRAAAVIENGAVNEAKSVSSAIISGTVTGSAASDVVINSQNDGFNGIMVYGDGEYTITNPNITLNGHGYDDFAGSSAGIMVTDNASLVVDGANINSTGAIRTAIWAGGNSNLVVKNSNVYTTDGDNTDFKCSMMNKVPWILGLDGNLRATNVLGTAHATYVNCVVDAEKWGALSTDSTQAGAQLTAIATDVIVHGESGYGSYADGAILNYYYGCNFQVPDMALIVAAGQCGATFGAANAANAGEFYAELPAEKKDAATVVNAGSFGVMWHKNQNGLVTVNEGTVFNCDETVFLIKSDSSNTAYPDILVDGAKLNSDTGVILHLMESDDAGMNMAGGGPGSPDMWMPEYVIPADTNPIDDGSDPTVAGDTAVEASFKNLKGEYALTGSIYNSRFTAGQNVVVSFDNADITGAISSGVQHHTLAEVGEVVTIDTYYKIGHVAVDVAPTVCNGVLVTLANGSVWTPVGTSYISSLTVDAASSIAGTVTVNGAVMTVADIVAAGGTVTGAIVVAA